MSSFLLHSHCSFLCRFFPKYNASPCNPTTISLIVIHLSSLCLSASLSHSHIHTSVYARIYLYHAFFFRLSNFYFEIFIGLWKHCILPNVTILFKEFINSLEFGNIGRLVLCCRIISKDTFFFRKEEMPFFNPQSFVFIIRSCFPCPFSFSSLCYHWIIFYLPHGLLLIPSCFYYEYHSNVFLT